jgi:hypothetical protein
MWVLFPFICAEFAPWLSKPGIMRSRGAPRPDAWSCRAKRGVKPVNDRASIQMQHALVVYASGRDLRGTSAVGRYSAASRMAL